MQTFINHHLCAAAALVALASSSQAQEVGAALAIRNLPATLASIRGVDRVDGQVVGFSRSYKAFFDRGGVEFTPALGHQAPCNMPLRFTLQSVRRGSQVLLAAGELPAPEARITGQRVSYDRGAIDEHYDVRVEGVEQSFSFAAELGGDGDLVVRGRIDTDLASRRNADGSVSYLLEGLGGVRYGLVTGIDAAGRRVGGELRCVGDAIELVLPDAFVDAASYPLILDPLIGTELLVPSASTGPNNSDPDVAYDLTENVYMVTMQNVYSGTDTDAVGQRLDGTTGAPVGTASLIDFVTSTVTHIRVANVNVTNQFLVVYAYAPGPFGPWDIRCRRVDAASGAMSAVVTVAATPEPETDPCASSEATLSDDEALVVWKDPTGIRGVQVTVPAAADPVLLGGSVLIGGSASSQAPCISKSGGSIGRHVVAWHEGFLTDAEIYAACVDRNLTILAPSTVITANTVNDTVPAVDGNGSSFVVAWQQQEAVGSRGNIRMERLSYSSGSLLTIVPETSLESDAGQDEATPDVCYLGQKYAVVYREELVGSPLLHDVVLWVVEPSTLERCGVRYQLDGLNAGGANYENTPRCVGKFAGSASTSSDEGIVVFSEALDVPPFSSVVIAQRFEGIGSGGPIVNLGGGCGVLGLHDTVGGPFALGNLGFGLRANGVPPIALTFLSLAVPAPLVPCGPCTLVAPIVLEFVPNPGTGTVVYGFSLPCDAALVGFQLDTQWAAFGTVASPCPLFASVSASNVLRSTLGL